MLDRKYNIMKKYISFLCLLILMLWQTGLYSQTTDNGTSKVKKNTISLSLLGTSTFAGITYNRLLNPRLNFELGLGVIGLGGGITYYFDNIMMSRTNYYLGVKSTYHTAIIDTRLVTYLPFGMTYINKKNITFEIDGGPAILTHYHEDSIFGDLLNKGSNTNIGIYGSFKVGLRF